MRITSDTVPSAYRAVLRHLIALGEHCGCQGKPTVEAVGAQIIVGHPQMCLITDPGRRFNYRYALGEATWNLLPRSDVACLKLFSKGIDAFVQDQPEDARDEAKWAYGPQIYSELGPLIRLLERQPESRRAVLRPGRDTRIADRGTGTPPCLESVQFLLRDGRLHVLSWMRSNDAYLGMPYDMLTLALWQRAVATALGVGTGMLTHSVGSLHFYERDRAHVNRVCRDMSVAAASLDSSPSMREVVDGSVWRDLETVIAALESDVGPLDSTKLKAASWAPIMLVLGRAYSSATADKSLTALKTMKTGVGW